MVRGALVAEHGGLMQIDAGGKLGETDDDGAGQSAERLRQRVADTVVWVLGELWSMSITVAH